MQRRLVFSVLLLTLSAPCPPALADKPKKKNADTQNIGRRDITRGTWNVSSPEREADFLGLQYHAASGYDPVAFIDFFERTRQREKTERGGIAKAFSTHPMTRGRITAAERTIEQVLPPREEYVVTTSRYD